MLRAILKDIRSVKENDPAAHSLMETLLCHTPLLAIIVSWLVIIFGGFGLLTPRNRTAFTAMLLAAVAAAGALFLIVELYSPVTGVISIPPSTLESALSF